MTRQRFAIWMAVYTLIISCGATAHAQLPDGCGSADSKRAADYTNAAANALAQDGNIAKYIALLREMESGLSSTCRAALNRLQPARVRCTAGERELVLRHYEAIIGAALTGEVDRMFGLFQNLEASVSRTCWLAVNQHDDRRIRQTCSAAELDMMASYVGPAMRAMQDALITYDASQLLKLLKEQTAKLSPDCSQAVAWMQQAKLQQQAHNAGKTPMQLPGVIDHGGGTLSAPGLGACTPSGCMAF